MRRFVNTEEFSRAGQHFLKHGYYTDALPGTRDYEVFWDEEYNRIKNGYSVGGVRITGYHYFHLNYVPMLITVEGEAAEAGTKRTASKELRFPRFWDGDYEYFWALEIARHGISKEEYEALGLESQILYLDGGYHLVVLKARGKGFSYKAGGMLGRNFGCGRSSKNYAIAADWTYLIEDGLLNKAWDTIAHLDAHTPFAQPKLKDTMTHKRAGYKVIDNGIEIEKGTRNEVMGVSCKDDVQKARGKRGELIFFEEAGKFPGLVQAWEISRPSVEQGAFTTGIQVAYGTGGTEEANYEGLEELFYNPEGHNCLPFDNIWDEGARGNTCSFFFPAHLNWEGFMDADGNSDLEGAGDYFLSEREKVRRKSKDGRALQQTIAENPLTPREATLQIDTNLFPTAEILAQLNDVRARERWTTGTPGFLSQNSEGRVVFIPSDDAHPILDWPLKKGMDPTGCVVIYEAPFRDEWGRVPRGLYYIGHDPYAHDGQSEGGSLGATYILKRPNNFSRSFMDCIVASYVGRPPTQDEYNRQLFLLAEYYGCKIGFENDRGNVIEYAKRHHLLHLLEEEFEMLDKKELQSKTTSRPYGMHMTDARAYQGQVYIRDWLLTPIAVDAEGNKKLVLHTITDMALLTELLKYQDKDSRFDRVKALMIAMYYQKELYGTEVQKREEEPFREFFERQIFA